MTRTARSADDQPSVATKAELAKLLARSGYPPTIIAELLAPSIQYADDGVPVPETIGPGLKSRKLSRAGFHISKTSQRVKRE